MKRFRKTKVYGPYYRKWKNGDGYSKVMYIDKPGNKDILKIKHYNFDKGTISVTTRKITLDKVKSKTYTTHKNKNSLFKILEF